MFLIIPALLAAAISVSAQDTPYSVRVIGRGYKPVISWTDGNSVYRQNSNPSWVEATAATNGHKGLLIRTQNCEHEPIPDRQNCTWCGGSQQKASWLTFSRQLPNGNFAPVTTDSIVFAPSNSDDSWGTEDPRLQYNPKDGLYYLFYTAYNGTSVQLSLATTRNPTAAEGWTKRGFVFPKEEKSKSGALLLRDQPPHYLFWGDLDIRVAQSNDPAIWPDIGPIIIARRTDSFDSRLVESGPPPMKLKNGDYLFLYNSAELTWPEDLNKNYLVGWAILDGTDPTKIKARSSTPLMGPIYPWEKGQAPYLCNVPNVVFLEAAYPIGDDKFDVYFGGADANIGRATIQVTGSATTTATAASIVTMVIAFCLTYARSA